MQFLITLLWLVGTPISLYFSAKFIRYGWLAGELLFQEKKQQRNKPTR